MSLATSCPSCGTVFRVVQDQLKISEGWVRCGHCQEVFNALEGLFDLDRREASAQDHAPDLAIPATSNPDDPAWMETRPAMFSDGKVLRERQQALQNRSSTPSAAPAPPPPPARRVTPTRVEISTRRTATWDPSIQEPEQGMAPTQPDPGAWRTTSAETTWPEPPQIAEPIAEARLDEKPAPGSAARVEFRSEAFSALATERLRRESTPEVVDLPLDWPSAPAPLSTRVEVLPPAAPPPDTVRKAPPEPPSPVQHQDATAGSATPEALDVAKEPPAPPEPEMAVTPSQPAAENLEKTLDLSAPVGPSGQDSRAHEHQENVSVLPDFVRQADSQARWDRPTVRIALGSAAAALASLLVLQIGAHWHNLIAARWPVTAPLLAHACAQWHCQLSAPQQLEALVVDSTTLSRPPGVDSYVLGVTLRNRASHAIAAPHIELSLTDMAGAVVLRRVLTPAEFRQTVVLSAQSDASWSLAFTSTNQRIAGYTLAAFYP